MPKTCQQCSDACRRPALDDEGSGPLIDVDALTRPKNDRAGTGRSPHRDPATQDQNRRPCFLDIYRPFGAAHGGDGLRRRDLKAIFALLLGSVDQQGLALQIDGIDFAVVVAVFQGESGAVLGNDG